MISIHLLTQISELWTQNLRFVILDQEPTDFLTFIPWKCEPTNHIPFLGFNCWVCSKSRFVPVIRYLKYPNDRLYTYNLYLIFLSLKLDNWIDCKYRITCVFEQFRIPLPIGIYGDLHCIWLYHRKRCWISFSWIDVTQVCLVYHHFWFNLSLYGHISNAKHPYFDYTHLLDVLSFYSPAFYTIHHRRSDCRPVEFTF
jgi:hypothetical protein